MNKFQTYSCFFLAFIFLLFAVVQYNDPDPYIWIPIYMFEAILCIGVVFKPIKKVALIMICIGYIVGSFYLFPETYQGVEMPMNERVPAIEEARESLGLLICAASTLWVLYLSSRKSMTAKTQTF